VLQQSFLSLLLITEYIVLYHCWYKYCFFVVIIAVVCFYSDKTVMESVVDFFQDVVSEGLPDLFRALCNKVS